MDYFKWFCTNQFILLFVRNFLVVCLQGPNVCPKTKEINQPVNISSTIEIDQQSYTWCLQFPPICLENRTSYQEVTKTVWETKKITIDICCDGFQEIGDYCYPAESNEFILPYEPVSYDRDYLLDQRRVHRSKRSTSTFKDNPGSMDSFFNNFWNQAHNQPKENFILINFTAYNRLFDLKLTLDNSLFSSETIFESTRRGKFHYDTTNALTGALSDENDSHVEGVLTSDGLFDGLIRSKLEEFYIEPSSRYTNLNSTSFHTIIYRVSDALLLTLNISKCNNSIENLAPLSSSILFGNYCLSSIVKTVTLDVVNGTQVNDSLNVTSLPNETTNQISGNNHNREKRDNENTHQQSSIVSPSSSSSSSTSTLKLKQTYWRDFDSLNYEGDSEAYGIRAVQRAHWPEERHERHFVIDPKKTTCMLYLQADHLFYEKMGSEEACIETMTRHVQKVNNIYRSTDFNQDGRSDNISFLIKRIKVHTTEALKDPVYRYKGSYGVEKYLELFSEEDYDAFCLAYMFTYRDFEGGTLGLAWTGDLKNAGGVCEKNGHYRGSLKSLNTGIVTLLNYGKHVPPIVSHVTLAHEIGHNFGSPHDPENEGSCAPGGEDGNYIMFARATSGDKRNNNHFSLCSLKSINAVLNTKARSSKGCFQEPQESICGNEVVEPGEECDCGWAEDCTESCCFPMQSNPPKNEIPCRLRPNVICSPSQGPCCAHDCRLTVGNKCRDDNGCRTASYCNGQGPGCPPSTFVPNKTVCNQESVCFMGECTGSICIAYGLESCQCKKKFDEPDTKLCELCCRFPGDDSTCKSSFEWNTAPLDVPDLYSKPGTPCNNYNGYCDIFQQCREVDPSGPLATLRRFLLSNESMASIKRWLNEQWICVIILCVMALLIVFLLVKVFEKRNYEIPKSELFESNCLDVTSSSSSTASVFARHRHNSSSSTSSSRPAMVRNHGNLVRTSLAFGHQLNYHQHDNHEFHCHPLGLTGNGWV
ncbi:disintegrin and metalloproteinase domain-containing protein 10-like [Panonychus citri]|uniref:disintegrin and metalloproteinase domain-containing protein 10-like n=1 Tax=Panonychus citri TaxID=50023 RepID=UPI002307034A|nr:disintegrin and metalloproteinase domain-containing protein 10-like [Panonychus citri]